MLFRYFIFFSPKKKKKNQDFTFEVVCDGLLTRILSITLLFKHIRSHLFEVHNIWLKTVYSDEDDVTKINLLEVGCKEENEEKVD